MKRLDLEQDGRRREKWRRDGIGGGRRGRSGRGRRRGGRGEKEEKEEG